jgi:hypothetical protein
VRHGFVPHLPSRVRLARLQRVHDDDAQTCNRS